MLNAPKTHSKLSGMGDVKRHNSLATGLHQARRSFVCRYVLWPPYPVCLQVQLDLELKRER